MQKGKKVNALEELQSFYEKRVTPGNTLVGMIAELRKQSCEQLASLYKMFDAEKDLVIRQAIKGLITEHNKPNLN